MHSTWTGTLSFSLVNIPVKLGKATGDNSLGLRSVRKSDGSDLSFTRLSKADGKEVDWSDVGKAYDAPDGSMVILTQQEVKAAYGTANKNIGLVMFTDAGNIPPMAAKSTYWIMPDKGGEKMYALLASALAATGKIAVVRFAMREREVMAAIRTHEGYLSLETLEWHADIRTPDFPQPEDTASEADRKLALQLVESMTEKYDHSAYSDTSAESLMAVIQGKIERGQVIRPTISPNAPSRGMPADLTAALQASVEAQKGKEETTQTRPARRRKAA